VCISVISYLTEGRYSLQSFHRLRVTPAFTFAVIFHYASLHLLVTVFCQMSSKIITRGLQSSV